MRLKRTQHSYANTIRTYIFHIFAYIIFTIAKTLNDFKIRVKAYISLQIETTEQTFYNMTKISAFRKGASSADILIIVYIVVAFLVAAILFPIAMTQVTSANTAGWNSAVATVFVVLLPIFAVLAVALHLLGLM